LGVIPDEKIRPGLRAAQVEKYFLQISGINAKGQEKARVSVVTQA